MAIKYVKGSDIFVWYSDKRSFQVAKQQQQEQQVNGLDFWSTVEKTDPQYTKKVNQKGGFTAINATWQIKQATRLWGPYGCRWGIHELKYDYIRDGKGEILEATLDGMFICPIANFEISTDIPYSSRGDSRKKLLTDLTTKALSKLGFSADIFMGEWDDNKYINQPQRNYPNNVRQNNNNGQVNNNGQRPPQRQAPPPQSPPPNNNRNGSGGQSPASGPANQQGRPNNPPVGMAKNVPAIDTPIARELMNKLIKTFQTMGSDGQTIQDPKNFNRIDPGLLAYSVWTILGRWPDKEQDLDTVMGRLFVTDILEK